MIPELLETCGSVISYDCDLIIAEVRTITLCNAAIVSALLQYNTKRVGDITGHHRTSGAGMSQWQIAGHMTIRGDLLLHPLSFQPIYSLCVVLNRLVE